jgi:hypothetical protein
MCWLVTSLCCAVAGALTHPDPAAGNDPAPGPIPCTAELSTWLAFHRFHDAETLGGIRDRLDGMSPAELRSLDRASPSRIGYADVRADLEALIHAHGQGVTIGEVTGAGRVASEPRRRGDADHLAGVPRGK